MHHQLFWASLKFRAVAVQPKNTGLQVLLSCRAMKNSRMYLRIGERAKFVAQIQML